LVTPSNPAPPGTIITIWATGLGQLTPLVPTGMLPEAEAQTLTPATVMIDGLPATVLFAGHSGCCVGVNQINAIVPRNARIGTEVPLSLSMEGESSNTVEVAIDSAPSSITIDGLSVRLAWDASTSSVIGYNVYRATTSGGPYTKLNSNVVTGTGYTDETLTAGQTYHYVVKSVSALNLESVASNEASAVVPVP
jgi:hypothetical protein